MANNISVDTSALFNSISAVNSNGKSNTTLTQSDFTQATTDSNTLLGAYSLNQSIINTLSSSSLYDSLFLSLGNLQAISGSNNQTQDSISLNSALVNQVLASQNYSNNQSVFSTGMLVDFYA